MPWTTDARPAPQEDTSIQKRGPWSHLLYVVLLSKAAHTGNRVRRRRWSSAQPLALLTWCPDKRSAREAGSDGEHGPDQHSRR